MHLPTLTTALTTAMTGLSIPSTPTPTATPSPTNTSAVTSTTTTSTTSPPPFQPLSTIIAAVQPVGVTRSVGLAGGLRYPSVSHGLAGNSFTHLHIPVVESVGVEVGREEKEEEEKEMETGGVVAV